MLPSKATSTTLVFDNSALELVDIISGVATEENFGTGVRQRRAHHHELERQGSGQQRDVQPGIPR
ncbi:MAG: hypothetical protein H6556_18640 [Lewinellaceae bacterium]|nr:hypothetical protein [Lewinellaceae bacterium]